MKSIFPSESLTVAEIATQYPSAVSIFTKYQIDFCCGGKQSLHEACINAGLNKDIILKELEKEVQSSIPGTIRFDTWDTPLLMEFIIQHHHQYVRKNIPLISELLQKVVDAHGESQPEVKQLLKRFVSLSNDLLSHMKKEEDILFPAIHALHSTTPFKDTLNVAVPMQVMEHEHAHAGEQIKAIRDLTNNYTPPANACTTFIVTYKRLHEFDEDLMQHIHLENNILFDKVRELTTHPIF